MKNIISAIAACLVTMGAYAQTDSSERKLVPPGFRNDTLKVHDSKNMPPDFKGDTLKSNHQNTPPDQDMNHDHGTMQHSGDGAPHGTPKGNNQVQPAGGTANTNSGNPVKVAPTKDGVLVKEGKVLIIKGGQASEVTSPVSFANGSRVMADGTLVNKDGTRVKLKEGDYLDFGGNYIHRNPSEMHPVTGAPKDQSKDMDKVKESDKNKDVKPKNKNMYLVPDSTLKGKPKN